MKLVQAEAFVEFDQLSGVNPVEVYNKIERIGRLCYKSEGLINARSHEKFLSKIKHLHHNAMIEHHNFAFAVSDSDYETLRQDFHKYLNYTSHSSGINIVSGSARAWIESQSNDAARAICKRLFLQFPHLVHESDVGSSGYETDAKLLSVPDLRELPYDIRIKHEMITVRVVCDRGVSHEIVRHRPCSYAQESTRYCNYSKEKFGGELIYVLPLWMHSDAENRFSVFHGDWKYVESSTGYNRLYNDRVGYMPQTLTLAEQNFFKVLQTSEIAYLNLLELGWSPQQARDILPNSLKTEIYISALIEEWLHFFKLRAADAAHPQMQEVAYIIQRDFDERDLLL